MTFAYVDGTMILIKVDRMGEIMFYRYKVNSFFDIEKTMECGQCFHYEKLGNKKYRVYGLKTVCEIKQINDNLIINTDNEDFWKSYFVLDLDYKYIYNYLYNFCEKQNDDFAIRALEKGKGIVILRQPFFETCCSYILSQQNNIPRIRKMIFDLSEVFSTQTVILNNEKYKCFPSCKDLQYVEESKLREIGLGYRAEYIELFVKNWENTIDRIKFQYENDFNVLKENKGIGTKVANCICLFGFEELDAFPVDIWMKRIIQEEYLDKGKELILPNKYAGVLQQYMYYYRRGNKK